MITAARNGWLPRNVEATVAAFTELIGTAISNAEPKAQLIVSRADRRHRRCDLPPH
jgi:hypothetical protein